LLLQYHGWQGSIKTLTRSTIERQIELSNTYITRGVKQFTIEEITEDKTTEEIIEVKYNYLSILVMHYLQTTLSTERAYKDIL
jgi:site-specific recombinase